MYCVRAFTLYVFACVLRMAAECARCGCVVSLYFLLFFIYYLFYFFCTVFGSVFVFDFYFVIAAFFMPRFCGIVCVCVCVCVLCAGVMCSRTLYVCAHVVRMTVECGCVVSLCV